MLKEVNVTAAEKMKSQNNPDCADKALLVAIKQCCGTIPKWNGLKYRHCIMQMCSLKFDLN